MLQKYSTRAEFCVFINLCIHSGESATQSPKNLVFENHSLVFNRSDGKNNFQFVTYFPHWLSDTYLNVTTFTFSTHSRNCKVSKLTPHYGNICLAKTFHSLATYWFSIGFFSASAGLVLGMMITLRSC